MSTTPIQELRVEQVMTPTPTCIEERCTFAGALAFLVRNGYQSAPVVDAAGRVRGLVSRAGLLAWLSRALEADPMGLTLREVGSRPLGPAIESPLRCQADARLDHAARQLVGREAPAALVVRGEELVGILTQLDIARALGWAETRTTAQRAGHCFGPGAGPATVADDAADRALMTNLPRS